MELIQATATFLERVDLKGTEVTAFSKVMDWLRFEANELKIAQGNEEPSAEQTENVQGNN